MTAALLLGVAGEPTESPRPSPADDADYCPLLELLEGARGTDIVIIEPDTGKADRIVHCPT